MISNSGAKGLRFLTCYAALSCVLLTLSACKESGVQGGNIGSSFHGVEAISVLSPTTIQLNWSQDKSLAEYVVYQKGVNEPLGVETFSSAIVSDLHPGTSYEFAVTGVDKNRDRETGFDKFVSVTTFVTFKGVDADGVTVKSATRVDLTWAMSDPSIGYEVYVKKADESWNFDSPKSSVIGTNMFSVTALDGGTEFCFFVVAKYADGTTEPSVADVASVDAAAPCVTTDSDMLNLPSISSSKVIVGRFPWFVAAAGDPSYVTDVFEASSDVRIASRIGNGAFRSFQGMDPGFHSYYALVRSADGSNQARQEVLVDGVSGGSALIRALSVAADDGAVLPPLVAEGNGAQNLGESIATGDFNCDGYADIAVGAPEATPYVDEQHFAEVGSVLVYYTYKAPPYTDPDTGSLVIPVPELWTEKVPTPTASFPEAQLIYYPVTAGGVRFGEKMTVGNVNGDCSRRGGTPKVGRCNDLYAEGVDIDQIYSCQDLAVTTDSSKVYVMFGNSLTGLVSGSGAKNYGVNELTCDAGSSDCRAVQVFPVDPLDVSAPDDDISAFGRAIAFGDYNNDGYDDLAVSALKADGFGSLHGAVFVYRGGAQGVFPSNHTKSFPVIDKASLEPSIVLDVSSSTDSKVFGYSLGSVPNSRKCVTDGTYQYRPGAPSPGLGYDFTKCDDLVVGAPFRSSYRGSIFTCKGQVDTIAGGEPDKQKILSWNCKEHWPAELEGTSSYYGHSVLGVANQNGYPYYEVYTAAGEADVTGALFVGAPKADILGKVDSGKVYGYYVTPKSKNHSVGGIQGILGSGSHGIVAQNTLPCNATNNNVVLGGLEHCNHQGIYPSPVENRAEFGYSLSTIAPVVDVSSNLPYLAVSAPYKDVLSANGSKTIVDSGAVYLYRPDSSALGVEISGAGQITTPQLNDNQQADCPVAIGVNCTWYSGGLSPFGPTIVYPFDLNTGANFGKGGMVGGDFDGDGSGDFAAASHSDNDPVSKHGRVYLAHSKGAFSASQNLFQVKLENNISKEINYRFELAKVIGDINGDGYDDVLTKIDSAGAIRMVLFYGSSSGLVTTPEPSTSPLGLAPLLFSNLSDSVMGSQFYRIGSVNGDAYDDVLLVGGGASYVFYGSFSGLVYNLEPQIAPIGAAPLKFATNATGNSILLGNYIYGKAMESIYGRGAVNQAVGVGDFNADGYSDFAVGVGSSNSLPGAVDTAGLDYLTSNDGRVIVVYGSSTGPQVDRSTGAIRSDDGAGGVADVVAKNPCSTGADPVCKVQMLANVNGDGVQFGWAVEGMLSLESSSGEDSSELLISDYQYNDDEGAVYFYKGGATGLSSAPLQVLVPKQADEFFGYRISSLGDVNGDYAPDIAVTALGQGSGSPGGYLYVFYTGNVGGTPGFFGGTAIGNTDYWGAPAIAVNSLHVDSSMPRPQLAQPLSVAGSNFAVGLSSVGDFNDDGYNDVIVSASHGDYNIDEYKQDTGYFILYFGGPNGLQIDQPVSSTPRCYSGVGSVCDPYRIYLPNLEGFELTYLSGSANGDVNGDGYPDLVLAGFGRNHPSGLAFSVGVFYVLY